jgi:glucose/arabinose dehydrogenase
MVAPFDLRAVAVDGPDVDWSKREGPRSPAQALFLPEGFSASIFAATDGGPRALTVAPDGTVFVSVPGHGNVVALRDRDGDGIAEAQDVVVSGLTCPYGLAVADDSLYVAQTQQVTRFPLLATPTTGGQPAAGTAEAGATAAAAATTGAGVAVGPGEPVATDLPPAPCSPHGYRPLALAPADHAMYVAVGSTCNVCVEEGPGAELRATVRRYPLDTPGPGTLVARGLRNVTALALNPWTGALWGVAPERDDLGDDEPPELITAIAGGGNYGWPYCYRTSDDAWAPDPHVPPPGDTCTGSGGLGDLTVPTLLYQAHAAPLGLAFHDGRGLPPAFGPGLFVAFHGSWDHSTGVGYKVIRIPFDGSGHPAGPAQEFALGWLPVPRGSVPGARWNFVPDTVEGRPVDVAIGPSGDLYVSDDLTDVVFRIAYTGSKPAA